MRVYEPPPAPKRAHTGSLHTQEGVPRSRAARRSCLPCCRCGSSRSRAPRQSCPPCCRSGCPVLSRCASTLHKDRSSWQPFSPIAARCMKMLGGRDPLSPPGYALRNALVGSPARCEWASQSARARSRIQTQSAAEHREPQLPVPTTNSGCGATAGELTVEPHLVHVTTHLNRRRTCKTSNLIASATPKSLVAIPLARCHGVG